MNNINFRFLTVLFTILLGCNILLAQSVREERLLIKEGNALFGEGKYLESAAKYKQALEINPSSAVGHYNLGLSQVKQVKNLKDTTQAVLSLVDNATTNLRAVASMAKEKKDLASKANYNLGNISFGRENYKEAVDYYKSALRLNPDDENARKNLRIAQKKLQQQNQDKNQDNQKQNDRQDKQDQKQDKQDQQQDKQDQQDKQKDNNINNQTADQILNAVNNKEAATRSKYNASKAEQKEAAGKSVKNW